MTLSTPSILATRWPMTRRCGGASVCGAGSGFRPVDDRHYFASTLCGVRALRLCCSRTRSGGHLDRPDDLVVAGAAAEVAGDGVADLVLARLRVALQQGDGGHDHPGGADAALQPPLLDEGLLHRVQLPVPGQPLHGGHAAPLGLGGEEQAGGHRAPVQEHGAGPAVPRATALLRPGQLQAVPEHLQQGAVGLGEHVGGDAVDLEADDELGHRVCLLSSWGPASCQAAISVRRVSTSTSRVR